MYARRSASVRVISPAAIRTPVSARSRANPATSAPGRGSSTQSTPSSPSSSTVRRAEAGSRAGSMSPGQRQVFPDEPDLESSEALLTERQRRFGSCRGRYDFTTRGIGGHAVPRSSEEDRDRLAGGLADDVPQSRLEGPVTPGMEGDGVQAPHVARDLERISADEELRVRLEAVHCVA